MREIKFGRKKLRLQEDEYQSLLERFNPDNAVQEGDCLQIKVPCILCEKYNCPEISNESKPHCPAYKRTWYCFWRCIDVIKTYLPGIWVWSNLVQFRADDRQELQNFYNLLLTAKEIGG